jgi:exodeoxyribonuclease VII small subunit
MSKKKTEASISYEEATIEIQQILKKLESGNTPIDQILAELQRATELIRFCKSKLHQVSESLTDMMKEEEGTQTDL